MLPIEVHTANDIITPEFLKDHIVLADGPSRNHAPIITLSGLRGHLIEYVILRNMLSNEIATISTKHTNSAPIEKP